MKAKDELGHRGEDIAAEHLTGIGMQVVQRNWRCATGEIDIVASDGPTLVVVEVKTRTSEAYGHPFDAVTPAKLRRLHLLAAAYIAAVHPGRRMPFRIDVVGVIWPTHGEPSVQHLREVH
ncbi:YraN family protein [Herbiconiux sp. VKM Ac-2851]|uniref:YraN family protein n=1 Tax=Herbiconiux sp. VKM Ac-2851 TaxID=2739025 RepID=UPI0015655C64|nr:YraN family protein [Herbiconiux sp. VKM Ac-2851]NQX36563.1 YraN family protein [Herbiconiux sp. VKM Ac-2851]